MQSNQDVLIAVGVVAEPSAIGRGLGCECSGIITDIGPGVSRHRVGDRVVVCSSGSFTTSMDVSEHLCVTAPDTMTFEDAASMPVVYSTAIYCLLDAARLAKGMVSTTGQSADDMNVPKNADNLIICSPS